MKKVWVGIALLLVATSSFAGVRYEFIQRTQSDIANIPSTELTGRAFVEGDHSRVDFITAANSYPPGAYVFSTNGSRTLTFVDPLNKSYTEVNSGAVAAAIGTTNIKVENFKSDVQHLEDHPMMAGLPTDHYRIVISYDMTVMFRSMPLKQNVRTEIEKWTTLAFGDVPEVFLSASGVRTGNPDIDKLIDVETTKVNGLPLKQVIKTTLTNPKGTVPALQPRLSQVRKLTRELIVTSIEEAKADGAAFTVPATYRKMDGEPSKAPGTQVTILSFDPGQ